MKDEYSLNEHQIKEFSSIIKDNKNMSKETLLGFYRYFGYDPVQLRDHLYKLETRHPKVLVTYDLMPDGTIANYL